MSTFSVSWSARGITEWKPDPSEGGNRTGRGLLAIPASPRPKRSARGEAFSCTRLAFEKGVSLTGSPISDGGATAYRRPNCQAAKAAWSLAGTTGRAIGANRAVAGKPREREAPG